MPVFSLLPSDENADRALCVKTLGELRRLGSADALAAWRARPGELFSAPAAAEASAAAVTAARLGIKTSVFETASLPVPAPPETLVKAEVTDEGVRLYRKSVKDFFPYAEFAVLAAGVLDEVPPSVNPSGPGALLEEAIKRTLGGAAPAAPAAPAGPPARETAFYLDFLTLEGARFRLRWDEADYSWLGKKKEYSSMENFRRTLEELHAFSFGRIPVTAAFTAVRSRAPVAPFRLRDLDAFDFNLRWFLAVTRR
ncbi:MAG: hypothetical protein FD189_1821 [Elusimicrobia bacterium]|nr:MAG: hypothetical protein FD154_1964 [Elusimicrobiota bacterium]KAF0154569.1 MAG: hypothetical protein FD189_1821 [Elusimicrobiota bacterium]